MLKQRIGSVVSRNVIGVEPEAPFSQALARMRDHGISCVVVLEQGAPMGIITERGLVRHLAANGHTLKDVPVRGIMSAPVTTVREDAYVYEALQLLVNKHIRHLVVVDSGGQCVGVLTLSNLIQGVGGDLLVEFHPVEQYMSRAVIAVEEDLDLHQVIKEMADRNISCLFHTRDGRPDGLVTERDVVRLAAQGHSLADMHITEIMSKPVISVTAQTPVHQAARLMSEHHIRRVGVVDEDGAVIGVATQTNIIRSLESNYIKALKQVIGEKETDLKNTEVRLDRVSLYLDSILNTSIDMAIVATDVNYSIIFYNDCAEHILGPKAAEVLGRDVAELHRRMAVESGHFEPIMEKTRQEGCHSFQYERRVDDQTRYFQARVAAIRNRHEEVEGYVFMVRDITERRRAEENIRYMAYHDILTGLPNRISFDERLNLELAHAERNQTRLAIMVMDLDHFKEVNDTMGHFTGDVLLEEVARRLSGTLRKSDTVARVGGDEFMMVLPSVASDEDALQAAAKMAEVFTTPVELKGRPWRVHLSVGVAFFPDHGTDSRKLVDLADQAMYEAKKEGRANQGSNICLLSAGRMVCRRFGD